VILSVSRSPVHQCDLIQCTIPAEVDDAKRRATLDLLSDSQEEGTAAFLLWSAYGRLRS
jgi:hypothetical protein